MINDDCNPLCHRITIVTIFFQQLILKNQFRLHLVMIAGLKILALARASINSAQTSNSKTA
jgi:hypothetical protein